MISGASSLLFTILWILWLVIINYVIISFLELFIHRYFMHKQILPKPLYEKFPYLYTVFESHALRHHLKWYKQFNHESDPVGKEENLQILPVDTAVILIATAPVWSVLALFFPVGVATFILMVIVHNRLWGVLHRQMHIPSDIFFKDWRIYKSLARYHYLHHKNVGKNFNVVFPFADFLLGRMAEPRIRDLKEMLALGLLLPRAKRTKAIVVKAQRSRREVFKQS
jgi:hypothetical protein